MALFFCIAGREPALSLAEFQAVFSGASIKAFGKEGWIFSVADIAAIGRLAGVVKWGEVHTPHFPPLGKGGMKGGCESIGALIRESAGAHSKICFGISVYDVGAGSQRTEAARRNFRRGGMQVKRWLAEQGHPARLVTSREATLSSVVVAKQKLLGDGGVEVCALATNDGAYLGRTSGVQSFEEWGKRDFGRPARSSREGMLPPKLARMMVNLARVRDGGVVLDPFCGSGTVLMEAGLLGYRVLGSDVSVDAVGRTRKNLTWVHLEGVRVEVSDVRSLPFQAGSVDAIVTEPNLGPPRRGRESQTDVERAASALQSLYQDAFLSFARVLKKGGRVVFVFPTFRIEEGRIPTYTADMERRIVSLGFIRDDAGDPELMRSLGGGRDGVLRYSRPDQLVQREIVIFRKV